MTFTQATFKAAILDPAAAVPAGIINPDSTAASKRFDVYRNNVAVSLTEALEAAFPVVRKLVGAEFFRAMAGVYLRKHPPKTPLMMFYGDAMPGFLARFGPTQSLRYLPDIARIELAMRHAYHAADTKPIAAAALSAIEPAALMGVRLKIAPATQTVISSDPVHGIYRANTDVDAPPPVMRPEAVLIARAGFDPTLHLIDAATAASIDALKAGHSLGQTIAMAGDTLDLGGVLGLLLAQGAVTEIY